MKFYSLLFALLFVSFLSRASQDTAVVVSHDNVVIQTDPSVGHTIYPEWASFPSSATSYRRVIMQLKFECAPGMNCGAWDYINSVYVGHVGGVHGDSLGYEIARYITPYGGYWTSGSGWNHTWYYDVTDFAQLLHDSVEVIYYHSGYETNVNTGWMINVKFFCIKGTPVREPVSITQLWDGSYRMGDPGDPVENHLVPVTVNLNAQATNARLCMINTGHGNDSVSGCMEFCAKYRNILWDNNLIDTKYIWRSDCGSNALYPQAGTWIYDRGGWCPGSSVRYDDVDILNLTGGTTHTINMDMEPYVALGHFGNLYTNAYLIQYKAPANSIDATLETIIAPSQESEFSRVNPVCNAPVVVISNSGTTDLTSLTFNYGVAGGPQSTYNWTGDLKFLQKDTVTLTTSVNWTASSGNFQVSIANPNGQADQYPDDDTAYSGFVAPTVLPSKIIIKLKTNSEASEYSYYIKDVTNDNIVFQKGNFSDNTLYKDTVSLPSGGCYQFYFSAEGTPSTTIGVNKDGLEFWAFDQYVGAGTLGIYNGTTGAGIKSITGTGPYGTQGGDFGTFYSMYFTTNWTLNVPSLQQTSNSSLDVFPNPTNGAFDASYNLGSNNNGNIELYNIEGRLINNNIIKNKEGVAHFDLSAYPAGVYILKLQSGNGTLVQRITKQ